MLERLTHKGPRKRLSGPVLFFFLSLSMQRAHKKKSKSSTGPHRCCFFLWPDKQDTNPPWCGPQRRAGDMWGREGRDLLSVTCAVETDKAAALMSSCIKGRWEMPVASQQGLWKFAVVFFSSVSEKQHKAKAAVHHFSCCGNYTVLSEGGSRNMRHQEGSFYWCTFYFNLLDSIKTVRVIQHYK